MNDSLLRRARALTNAVNNAVEIVEKEKEQEIIAEKEKEKVKEYDLERRIKREQEMAKRLESQYQPDATGSHNHNHKVVPSSTEPRSTVSSPPVRETNPSSRLTSNDYKSNAINIVQDVMQSASLGDSLKRSQTISSSNQAEETATKNLTADNNGTRSGVGVGNANSAAQENRNHPDTAASRGSGDPTTEPKRIPSSHNHSEQHSGDIAARNDFHHEPVARSPPAPDTMSESDAKPVKPDRSHIRGAKQQQQQQQQLTRQEVGSTYDGTAVRNTQKPRPKSSVNPRSRRNNPVNNYGDREEATNNTNVTQEEGGQSYANTFKDLRQMSFANVHHNANASRRNSNSSSDSPQARARPKSSNSAMRRNYNNNNSSNSSNNDINGSSSPLDKRSGLVDRNVGPRKTVLCYICCAEYQLYSLAIHQKTCLKKHKWGLQNIIDDESMTKKDAMKRFRKCCEPGAGPITPLPAKGAEREEFDSYNEEALELFHEHATRCLWCRTTNKAAMDALRKAEEDARRRAEEEEEARRRREEEEARRRAAEDAARRQAEEDARRLAEEEEARRRALEAEAKRLADEAIRQGLENDAARRREQEEADRLAEEIAEAERRRLRLLAMGKKKFLKKGEGTSAASQMSRIQGDRDRDERAKYGSVARKFGGPSSSSSTNGGDEGGSLAPRVLLEVDAEMDENWDQSWDKEKFEKFEKMRSDLLHNASVGATS